MSHDSSPPVRPACPPKLLVYNSKPPEHRIERRRKCPAKLKAKSDVSKGTPGFTLFEVLLALGLLVFSVSMIARLEFGSLTRVLRDRDEIEKIFLIKKELYTHFFSLPKQTKKIVTKLENPEIVFTTEFIEISPKSSLAKLKDNLQLIQTQGRWKIGKDEFDATMVACALKPKKDKEKEKK